MPRSTSHSQDDRQERTARLTQTAEWPDWVVDRRVPDEVCARAYENAGHLCRAAVKTAMAMYFRYDEPMREVLHESRGDPMSGFWRSRTVFPAPWAVIAVTPRYTASARLLAALMPAIMCGVPQIACVCVDGSPSEQTLVTCELAGIGSVLTLSLAELCALLEETQPGPGRLVLLHEGDLDLVRTQARSLHVPCYEERRPPVLTIPRPEIFDLDVLRFAQGEQPVSRALHSPAPQAPDVLYASAEAVRNHCLASTHAPFSLGMAPLALAPGCEGFWLHHGLGRSFFLAHRVGFGLDRAICAGE
ncbi:MAG: hypothetical protein Q4F72_08760 [Desulfovibrionaceae bacterium]|nr:hypothetical protein [Desulfovibrionaceae bacterium]